MDHKRAAWAPARSEVKRTTGRRLQSQRAALFGREPLCRECTKHGFTTIATVRDHIVPLAEGGQDDDSNIQPLCDDCHREKTLAEALRGRGLQAAPAPVAACAAPGRVPQLSAHPGGVEKSGVDQAETDPQVKFFRAQVSEKFSREGR